VVINHSQLGKRRVKVAATLGVQADLGLARSAAERALSELPLRDPARDIEVDFTGWTEHGIPVEVSFWIDFGTEAELRAARTEAVARVHKAWTEAGIALPTG
jgi:small conductance mechanosensitive channel